MSGLGAPHSRRQIYRQFKSRVICGLTVLATVIALAPLFVVLSYLLSKGIPNLDLDFLLKTPAPMGQTGGGMGNAIVGSVELVGIAMMIAVPVGIAGGIYLAESPNLWLARSIRYCADLSIGIPSIVVGLFIYTVLVRPMNGFSTLAGAVSLAIIMIPLITRTAEETIRSVPGDLREAALALGVPHWRTTVWIVARAAGGGMVAGVILAVARVTGETAPLLFTASGNNFWSIHLTQPINSLTVQVYNNAMSPFIEQQRQAWAGALFLTLIILALELGVRRLMKGRPRTVI